MIFEEMRPFVENWVKAGEEGRKATAIYELTSTAVIKLEIEVGRMLGMADSSDSSDLRQVGRRFLYDQQQQIEDEEPKQPEEEPEASI